MASVQQPMTLTKQVALKLTPLRVANVPPPMAFCTVALEHKPTDVALSKSGTRLAVLSNSHLAVYALDVTKRPMSKPSLLWQSDALAEQSARHVTFIDDEQLYVLTDSWVEEESSLWRSEGEFLLPQGPIFEPESVSSLTSGVDYQSLYLQFQNGAVHQIDATDSASDLPPQPMLIQNFPAFAPEYKVISLDGQVSMVIQYQLNTADDLERCIWLDQERSTFCERTHTCSQLHFIRGNTSSSYLHDYAASYQICSPDNCRR